MHYLIKVIPWSKKNLITPTVDMFNQEILKIHVTTQAQKGKANEHCIELLADYFKIPKRHITIVSWHTSSYKTVKITK